MSSPKRNPHIEQPTEEELRPLIEAKPAGIRDLYFSVHRLVLESLPDVRYEVDCTDAVIGYGARQFGYDGWGMGALSPHTKWVSLIFFRGTDLKDPGGLLEGTGKRLRHVKIRSLEELEARRDLLKQMLHEAAYGSTNETTNETTNAITEP